LAVGFTQYYRVEVLVGVGVSLVCESEKEQMAQRGFQLVFLGQDFILQND